MMITDKLNSALLVAALFISSAFSPADNGPKNLTGEVKPVYTGIESTALSIFDTNPESPDGKYLSFIRYLAIVRGGHEGPVTKAEVMIKEIATGKLRKIYDVNCTNHNGAHALWVNDSLVAFQVNHLKDFALYNVTSWKSMFGLINGELGHKSFGNRLFYTVCNSRLLEIDSTRVQYNTTDEGIFSMDCLTGKKRMVVAKSVIIKAFMDQNHEVTQNQVSILHVEPNPNGDKILFNFRYFEGRKNSLNGFVNGDGTGIRWIPVRPMHVVWFDNQSMMGVDTTDPEKKIYQYDMKGNKTALLGGTSTHAGSSPDRKWYAGDSPYYGRDKGGITYVYLYRKGDKNPVALIAEWRNNKITWDWVAHVNPSFSSDGKRLYFIRALNNVDKFEAVYIDLSNN